MRAIAISFTLKDQDENEILELLQEFADSEGPDQIVIHGFLPRRVVLEKGFSTAVVDALDKHFPIQLNLWNEVPLREDMALAASMLNARAWVIGDVKEGVVEEVILYQNAGVSVSSWGRNGIVRMKRPESSY